MKTILLPAHDDEGQEARLQVAIDVTRSLGGHLVCLGIFSPPYAITYAGYDTYGQTILTAEEQEHVVANRARVEARLAREDIAWEWREARGEPAAAIEAAARLADLVVLSSRLDGHASSEFRHLVVRVVMEAERPVLAVPPRAAGIDLARPMLVAWDGSRQADTALRGAVPLLALSSSVVLLDIDAPQGAFAAEEAARYLSRYGIHPGIEAVQRDDGDTVCGAILDRAHAMGTSCVVMGAYGHSPTVEAVFGGVTRAMLAKSDVPLLLAH